MVAQLVIDEFERIWKEAVVGQSISSPRIRVEVLRKPTKTLVEIVGVTVEIRTGYRSNTSQKYHR
jgi:hypothetical protein